MVVLKEDIFDSFYIWEDVVILKEVIYNSFYFQWMWWSWNKWFLTVSTFDECGSLEKPDFEQFLHWEDVVGLKEEIFNSFYIWEDVVVLKEVIFNSFYFGQVWWSWNNWFLTVSTVRGCGSLETTHF